ncbi:MAG: 23S rRNA (adenine(2503)-C(2))-methyltransferase RlmN [Armatimonadota bacterium]|nr:23S rRNA (adenine(2503)-C(2))-methyltransferase RlmN [Armatimonadota bacterium]MDR7451795.1 23S rRNA (adenine(2503)-C(2))-methyltransferase RlmN [Armatimonadota bacterium]MDR7467420.1 23S rRNA (adenine(2503)-C(2))-methyltransferase RlmN [Armatimonadota bacterium]MDR7494190.1 23S rRNA (adenine(2503)-C(2))-methyltransferase RlmN [Armatimonadota bacterium]MDR7498844.1 23S rRNA (adenine(2503)-C(2))-methyltransferase RlmN [Armatimonadota bacterium]
MATSLRAPVELKGLTVAELEAFAREQGEPAYRGRQLARWLYRGGVTSFAEMTDLPGRLRGLLAERAHLLTLSPEAAVSADGGDTVKYLIPLGDGGSVETVFMRYADGRRSVCLSTQVGCGMGCTFCATGLAGLTRNLSAAEIVEQVLLVQREQRTAVTNVVFMGMGEPLANYAATLRAVRILNAPWGLGIGMRHLTLSTVGLVPQIRALAGERLQLTLAVSLHAPDDELRSALVPVNRRWPIADLLEACRDYVRQTGRRVSFEYVLLEGVNDRPEQAAHLGRLLTAAARKAGGSPGRYWHVNLIPWNPVAGLPYRRPSRARVDAFAAALAAMDVPATIRLERGVEIAAACGQLQRTRGLPPAPPPQGGRSATGELSGEDAHQS